MINNSGKERIKLAHQLLDKQLSSSSFARSNMTKESQGPRGKNVQLQISQLERKLMDLEKKMENIDVSSDNEDDEQHGVTFVNIKNKVTRDVLAEKSSTDKQRMLQKNRMNLKQRKKYSESQELEEEEDSGDESNVYAKIQNSNQRKIPQVNENLNNRRTSNSKVQIMVSPPQNSFNVTKNTITKIQNRPQTIETQPKSLSKNPLRSSVKSIKSNKSRKSVGSIASNTSKRSNNNSVKKMKRSLSRDSFRSGGLNGDQLRDLHLENAKDTKRISNLQKQLNHYKRLSQKQQQKLEQYRVMEIEFRRLEANFAKSEQIRKQQKKIIQNLKVKNV